MKFTHLFLSIVWTNLLTVNVDGAASFNPIVSCSRIAPFVKVCATASYTSPSPAALANGTTVYLGGYSSTYTIVKDLMEGEMFTGSHENDAGITIDVVRDDSDVCTVSVTLDGGKAIECNSCKYCGDESYKADCSNIKNGRMLTMCESAEDDDVFFPLTALALPKVNAPVRAPVRSPRRAPVAESRRPPVRAPRRAPVAEPRRPPVQAPRRAPVAGPRRSPVREPRRAPVKAPVRAQIKSPSPDSD